MCSGNICRSPTAEVVLRSVAQAAGRAAEFVISSAGTGAWHAGADMDERSRATLQDAGYLPGAHLARQFRVSDFDDHDLVLAIDRGHLKVLIDLAQRAEDPERARSKVALLRSYDALAVADGELEVPDPYYGGPDGFREVLGQVERACAGLLALRDGPAPQNH